LGFCITRSLIVVQQFLGIVKAGKMLDNPQKLLKKARIGVMQKDWIKQ